ncbi:MAG TPA: amidohydrolase family protein [Candidatus Binatia bacterium]|nr:amidohydrolase family protein [Candidatus Binatia bacterium]
MSAEVFANLSELSRLPWFEMHHDRLIVSDRSLGPVIDMHSHIALAYLLPMRVDLYRATLYTEHYLPPCCPIDFEVYQNKNLTPAALRALKRDLTLGSISRGGMRATHTVPNLVREMDELGIVHSVLLPIDLPYISKNAAHALAAARREPKLLSFGSVHPIVDRVGIRVDEQAHAGARGIKVHPAVQLIAPDHPKALALYRLCGARNLPILWHCGPVGIELRSGRRRSQVALYEKPIAEHPRTKFVLGHSGALQMERALDLACRYPNVWLELSGQSLTNVRTILDRADPDRVVYGSDWPFYHQALGIAKVLLATQGREELRSKVLFRNAARLLGLST